MSDEDEWAWFLAPPPAPWWRRAWWRLAWRWQRRHWRDIGYLDERDGS